MPGVVAAASVPSSGGHPIVMPASLCSAFTRSFAWPTISNEYKDGTKQITALTTSSHKAWKMGKKLRLSDSTYTNLYNFWVTYHTQPFYFYDPYEVAGGASPGSNYDATGASAVGRYKVVFVGDWNQANNIAHVAVSIDLVEVV
jgi:hypothetical protein